MVSHSNYDYGSYIIPILATTPSRQHFINLCIRGNYVVPQQRRFRDKSSIESARRRRKIKRHASVNGNGTRRVIITYNTIRDSVLNRTRKSVEKN